MLYLWQKKKLRIPASRTTKNQGKQNAWWSKTSITTGQNSKYKSQEKLQLTAYLEWSEQCEYDVSLLYCIYCPGSKAFPIT